MTQSSINSSLSTEELNYYLGLFELLQEVIIKEQLFLNCCYSLEQLSLRFGLNQTELATTIKLATGRGFASYFSALKDRYNEEKLMIITE